MENYFSYNILKDKWEYTIRAKANGISKKK